MRGGNNTMDHSKIKLKDLKPAEYNPRTITESQAEKLKNKIEYKLDDLFSRLPNTNNNNSTMSTIRSNMRRTNKLKQTKHPKT